jgi:hypothetical protein
MEAMIFMVLTFGAPVIDAQGNKDPKISLKGASLRDSTVDVICQIVG